MILDNFCVFILTHGRPNNVVTYDTLEKHRYTGPLYIIIDNEDKTAEGYYKHYGDKVIMFDKKAISKTFDEGDNFDDRRTIVYARNACFQIAKELGFTYFMELDDDYVDFRYKQDESRGQIDKRDIKSLDNMFRLLLEFYKSIPAKSIAIAQGGDFLGGKNGNAAKNPQYRKCMNSFICSTDRPFKFYGRINEDVNTYTLGGLRGELFFTVPNIALQQKATQANTGGMSDIYNIQGTYVKSFYTVLYAPGCAKVKIMQCKHPRLHHTISWNNTTPAIIREGYKKRVKGVKAI